MTTHPGPGCIASGRDPTAGYLRAGRAPHARRHV